MVWSVYTDVACWPEWTESVTTVELDPVGPLSLGSRATIKQPRFPLLVWEVTDVVPGRSWTWRQRSPGGTTLASHEVVPQPDGTTLVRQRIDQRGPVGVVVGVLTRGLTRRYLDMEARGLKAASERRLRDAPAA